MTVLRQQPTALAVLNIVRKQSVPLSRYRSTHPSSKFDGNLCSGFCVIILTNQPTNTHWWKHNLREVIFLIYGRRCEYFNPMHLFLNLTKHFCCLYLTKMCQKTKNNTEQPAPDVDFFSLVSSWNNTNTSCKAVRSQQHVSCTNDPGTTSIMMFLELQQPGDIR